MSATAGIAALEVLAGEPVLERADAMAARLKDGIRNALTKMEVTGHVHGIGSIVHVAVGVECDCAGDICTLPHAQLAEATAGPRADRIKIAMANEGVDMMGGIGFMVSAVHEERQRDKTAEAFERALAALRDDGGI
jgi:glutamate-1-semialdehyde aminotransferase